MESKILSYPGSSIANLALEVGTGNRLRSSLKKIAVYYLKKYARTLPAYHTNFDYKNMPVNHT